MLPTGLDFRCYLLATDMGTRLVDKGIPSFNQAWWMLGRRLVEVSTLSWPDLGSSSGWDVVLGSS